MKYTVKDMGIISSHDRNGNIMYSLTVLLKALPHWQNTKPARSQNHSRLLGQGRTRAISWFWTLRSRVIFVHLFSHPCEGPLCQYEKRCTGTPLMSNCHEGIVGSHFSDYVKKVWVRPSYYQFDPNVLGLSCLSSWVFFYSNTLDLLNLPCFEQRIWYYLPSSRQYSLLTSRLVKGICLLQATQGCITWQLSS